MSALFIMFFALCNMIGGRWKDVAGAGATGGRVIFRVVLPALAAAGVCYSLSDTATAIYVLFAVGAGSAVWAVPGHAFEEINGKQDHFKYPLFIRQVGLYLVPLNGRAETQEASNRLRGVVKKGLRGAYDLVTFVLLMAINPLSIFLWLFCFLQGAVFWLAGRIFGTTHGVLAGEAMWGGVRGALIWLALASGLQA